MSVGWNVLYAKGPLAWVPMIQEVYANLAFILLAVGVSVLCILRDRGRLLNGLILAWAIPFSVYVLFTIVIKPTHFLIPIALPLFSSLAVIFEMIPWQNFRSQPGKGRPIGSLIQAGRLALAALVAVILCYQVMYNLAWDVNFYRAEVRREQDNEEIAFYTSLERDYLSKLPTDMPLQVLKDVRTYIPQINGWNVLIRSKPASYEVVKSNNIDLVIVWNQRALDYTQPGTLDQAIDRSEMEQVYNFYWDVRRDQVEGYNLLAKSACCSAFLRTSLDQRYFPK
jgi:hypothetical protein